jgi:hypothetical protein
LFHFALGNTNPDFLDTINPYSQVKKQQTSNPKKQNQHFYQTNGQSNGQETDYGVGEAFYTQDFSD